MARQVEVEPAVAERPRLEAVRRSGPRSTTHAAGPEQPGGLRGSPRRARAGARASARRPPPPTRPRPPLERPSWTSARRSRASSPVASRPRRAQGVERACRRRRRRRGPGPGGAIRSIRAASSAAGAPQQRVAREGEAAPGPAGTSRRRRARARSRRPSGRSSRRRTARQRIRPREPNRSRPRAALRTRRSGGQRSLRLASASTVYGRRQIAHDVEGLLEVAVREPEVIGRRSPRPAGRASGR